MAYILEKENYLADINALSGSLVQYLRIAI